MVLVTFVVRAALQADPNWWYVAYAVAATAVVVWALRPNIKRLREGTERLVGLRARAAKKRRNKAHCRRSDVNFARLKTGRLEGAACFRHHGA